MKNDTEKIIQKIDILIESLEKTENSTIQFYETVITEINACKSMGDLKKILDGRLIHAAGITDYGGYNREQCDLFYEVCKIAVSIFEGKLDK